MTIVKASTSAGSFNHQSSAHDIDIDPTVSNKGTHSTAVMSTNQRLQPPRPRLFDEHGVPTPSAAAAWIHGSALDVSSSTTRFPLRITNHGPYLAPLPYVTEGDRSLQQTTTDINALGQLYIVSPVSPLDLRTLPFNENQSVLATRVELGRFGHPNWQSYPLSATIPARPDLKGSPALLVQQAWMPPYAMPRHPTMAYWGRDLSSTNNSDTTLPTMRAWTPAGQVEQRPMFIHSTEDGELTDRGWGPGVSVHPDLRHGLSRATGSMQRWTLLAEAMQLSEAQREHEERMHNEYATGDEQRGHELATSRRT